LEKKFEKCLGMTICQCMSSSILSSLEVIKFLTKILKTTMWTINIKFATQSSTMEKRKRNENSTLDIIQINENILLFFCSVGSMFDNIFRHTFKLIFVCSKFQLLLVLYYFYNRFMI